MKIFWILCAFVFFLVFSQAEAQHPMHIGGEVGLQLPTGDFGDAANAGFGISGIFQYYLQPGLVIGGTIGYQSWGSDVDGVSFSNIPIMALLNYYFTAQGMKPFIGVELGLNASSSEIKFFGISQSNSETNLGFSVLGGIETVLNEDLNLRVNAKYNIIFGDENTTFFGINAGLMYKLGD